MSTPVKQLQAISDEITLLMALTRAYRKSPIDIITATTNSQALEQINIFTFQLILLDLDISDGDGLELLRVISNAQPGVPILLLTTGNSSAPELLEQINQRRPFGCWHLLEKPFELKKLTEAIERGLLERNFVGTEGICHLADLRRCRRFERRDTITIALNGHNNPPLFPATLNDISVSGLGLTTSTPLPTSQRISFTQKFMHQTGTVIWSKSSNDGYRSGIRFT